MEDTYPNLRGKQKEAMAFVDRRVDASTNTRTRSPMEQYWDTCAAYYEGSHNYSTLFSIDYADYTSQGDDDNLAENRILPMVQREVSTLLSGKPQVVAVPEGADFKDRLASRIAKEGWEEFVKRKKMDKRWRTAVLGATITGTSAFKTCWDPRLNDTGDVRAEPFTCWEFWVDPYCVDIDDAQWAATHKMYGLEKVQAMFPELREELKARAHPIGETWHRRHRLFSATGRMYAGALNAKDNTRAELGIMVTDFWARPSKQFPKGLRVLTAGESNNRLLLHKEIDNPYVGMAEEGFMELPFDVVIHTEAMDSIWGIPLVGPLMSLQQELNQSVRDTARIRRRFARPRPVVDSESRYAGEGLPTMMDELLVVAKDEIPPRFMEQAQFPMEFMLNQRATLLEAMGTIAAQSEATQAKNPDGVRTGVALEELIERDQSVKAPIRTGIIEAMSNVARRWMLLTQKYQTAPQTVRRVGLDASVSVSSFKGADLKGCNNIVFVLDESAGLTRADKRRWLEERVNLGLIDPMNPEDKNIIARMLEDGSIEEANEDWNIMQRKAERQLEQMTSMENKPFVIPPEEDEDHMVFWQTFTRFKNKPAFLELETPWQNALRDAIEIRAHLIKQAHEAEKFAQAMAGGQPGNGGSPPKEPGVASQPAPKATKDDVIAGNQLGGMR